MIYLKIHERSQMSNYTFIQIRLIGTLFMLKLGALIFRLDSILSNIRGDAVGQLFELTQKLYIPMVYHVVF